MLTSQNLNWISGLVEGEGYFGYDKSPVIKVEMTDKDVVEKLAAYWKSSIFFSNYNIKYKPKYVTSIHGKNAIGWMLTLYSLLGDRRRSKIEDVLIRWKAAPGNRGWQKAYWKNRKEQADAKRKARDVEGVAAKPGDKGSSGSNKT